MTEKTTTSFGSWTVAENGDMYNARSNITIEGERLAKNNIFEMLFELEVDFNEFMHAYRYACQIKKIKNINWRLE